MAVLGLGSIGLVVAIILASKAMEIHMPTAFE
jgi:UDP-N-acetyl-D-mannosaminuronate dehydrogenase